jgi:hypothetical protein
MCIRDNRESYWIALCTYNLIFVSAVGILVGYILSFEPTAYPYIICICIIFCSCVTWALIFVPKAWIIARHPDRIQDQLRSVTQRSSQGPNFTPMIELRSGASAAQLLAGMGGSPPQTPHQNDDKDPSPNNSVQVCSPQTPRSEASSDKPKRSCRKEKQRELGPDPE